ncbi:MAG: hypothetical protein D6731_18220 [Planctomycetota bacterium]|nr:MAG: hypothetical protein D6731_18220 [Planctomycetota bacterium]
MPRMTPERIDVRVAHPHRCPYCHDAVRPEEEKHACEGCMAWMHAECFAAYAACGACGRAPAGRPAPAPARSPGAPSLLERAKELNERIESRGSPIADTAAERCRAPGCPEARLVGSSLFCARHRAEHRLRSRRQDARTLLGIGLLNLVVFAGIAWFLRGSGEAPGRDDVLGIFWILSAFGALATAWGAWVLVRVRREGDPSG